MLRKSFVTLLLISLFLIPCFSQIQLKVTLSGAPTRVNIEKKNLKYGKFGVFCMIWDDRAPSSATALPVMPTFSDGAGHEVPYTATVAFNSVNRYGVDAPGLSFTQIKELINRGWGFSCHGYIHNKTDWPEGFTVEDNVLKNRDYFFEHLEGLGVEYLMRTGVVPTNDAGYHLVWKEHGSLCGTSQNQFDGMPAIPEHDYTNNSVGDISRLNGDYHVFARGFGDIVSESESNRLITKFATLIEQSTPAINKSLFFGTHQTDNTYFLPALNYLKNNSEDHIWVTSMHELMEYGETNANTNLSYSVSGNVVTITLDQNVPEINRWRDISLGLNTDQQIVNVESTGADRVTFNTSTGLINVFKMKTSGFSPLVSDAIVLPMHFTSFGFVNDALVWSVADKENFSHYEIERSKDKNHFSTIGKTGAETFRDPAPVQNQFYRIKAIEKDGKFVYSNTLHSTTTIKQHATASVEGSSIHLRFFSPGKLNTPVRVFNTAGQLVYQTNVKADTGWNPVHIDTLPDRGVLLVRVLNETVRISK